MPEGGCPSPTAPVAIVDPLTREQFGDQIDAFGHSVHDAATPQ
ncbi:MAG: hypothetical protein WA231_20890 [Methylocella sp.]